MKIIYTILTCFILSFGFQSCCKEDDLSPSDILGEVLVDLDANKSLVRSKEALIGNMICDGIKNELDRRGELVDFAIINGGGIRFDPRTRPNGIYMAGVFTSAMVDEILPFGNTNVIVKVTGKELKSILERSVAQLPLAEGAFLQVSQELKITIDTTKAPQVINEFVSPAIIVSPGSRITSIKINNVEYDSLATYTLVVNDFLAEQKENDGYITFRNMSSEKKENLGDSQSETLKQYIKRNTPIAPVIGGRIIYQ